jgi:hypothetical protein
MKQGLPPALQVYMMRKGKDFFKPGESIPGHIVIRPTLSFVGKGTHGTGQVTSGGYFDLHCFKSSFSMISFIGKQPAQIKHENHILTLRLFL